MSEYVTVQQKRAILDATLVQGDFTLASGIKSERKIEVDRIRTNSGLFHVSVAGFARCIKDNIDFDAYESIALITMATGATRFGDPLADSLPVFHIPSRKDQDGNLYIPERTQGLPCIFVDDVYSTGSTFEKAKRLIGGKLLAAFALADRSGQIDPVLSDGEKVHCVFQYKL